MSEKTRSLRDLNPGESGIINRLKNTEISSKLLEMGLLPGTEIRFNFAAPLGDPVCIHVEDYDLSSRCQPVTVRCSRG